jgi:hypothetical protein
MESSTDPTASTETGSSLVTDRVASQNPSPNSNQDTDQDFNQDSDQSLLQSKAAILAILFLGTGALGIPLLWTNQRFNNKERFLWASIAILYSLSLLLFLGWFVLWLKAQVMG